MKVVILAGGLGTRLAEETDTRPKPMVEVGDQPVLWHIMKHYGSFGFSDFCIALGYKGEVVKRYFLDYALLAGTMTVQLANGRVTPVDRIHEDWTIHLVDTGRDTNTGGRVARLRSLLEGETFMLTYGDGVSNIDLARLLEFHRTHGKIATITAVRPPARFGEMVFGNGDTVRFTEKPQMGEGWINGGFMVFEPAMLDLITGDDVSLEADVLEQLSEQDELVAYRHDEFWQCVDTLRELRTLRSLWDSNAAPWVTWQ
ncbi:MAG TPA: glucose-1-phosphate cytidylyltransferase [Gaiellaceae bacterium]|nr:glucose-1-phosphate cytidylyltransferase [Gaiellaceae bacterium]